MSPLNINAAFGCIFDFNYAGMVVAVFFLAFFRAEPLGTLQENIESLAALAAMNYWPETHLLFLVPLLLCSTSAFECRAERARCLARNFSKLAEINDLAVDDVLVEVGRISEWKKMR